MNQNKTAAVLTWGCTHNQKDSQLIEQQLIDIGYKLIPDRHMENAEVIVLNTCTVKNPTEDKILHVLDSLKESEKEVIVTGCLSQAEPEFIGERYPEFTILGVNAANKISLILNNVKDSSSLIPLSKTINKRNIRDNNKNWSEKPLMKSTQWNSNLNIVQINEGCLNSCTFCSTKKARGHLRSYKRNSIITAIRRNPTPEVWLTSQDTACWGFDIGDNLANLLKDIDRIKRKFWVRVGMGNPNNLIKILDDIIDAYRSPKVYKFLHLPVQAGSNDVLDHMKRGYTVEEYEFIVERFYEAFPKLTLSTDVICGYPTESENDFQQTIDTLKKTRPSITNISRYWARRGTPAFEMDQLSHKTRKERSQKLTKLTEKIQNEDNEKWIGWEGEVYLAEKGKKGGLQGRNIYYKPIIVHTTSDDIGTWKNVKITEARTTYFMGELVN